MSRHETHHKAAERHLNDAVSHLIQAKASAETAKDRNTAARAAHEAAIEYHTEGRQVTVDREVEADEILAGLNVVVGS